MDLHVLGYPEHDLTISGKCLSVCVWDKNCVASEARELIRRISENFIFGVILTIIDFYQLLLKIALQVSL